MDGIEVYPFASSKKLHLFESFFFNSGENFSKEKYSLRWRDSQG